MLHRRPRIWTDYTPEQVKQWRHELCMTQEQAADALGISLLSFEQFESGVNRTNGKVKLVDHRTALAMEAIRFAETLDSSKLLELAYSRL